MSTSGPSLPPDSADDRPRPLLGVSFWVMVVFGLVCVLAGVVVTLWGPRLFVASPAPVATLATPDRQSPNTRI